MTTLEPQKLSEHLTLADVATLELICFGGLTHRVSKWRGLRPGEGIPDDMRMARTYCGEFIPRAYDVEIADSKTCTACQAEHERISRHSER